MPLDKPKDKNASLMIAHTNKIIIPDKIFNIKNIIWIFFHR